MFDDGLAAHFAHFSGRKQKPLYNLSLIGSFVKHLQKCANCAGQRLVTGGESRGTRARTNHHRDWRQIGEIGDVFALLLRGAIEEGD